jgi:hypothetical protein
LENFGYSEAGDEKTLRHARRWVSTTAYGTRGIRFLR